MNSDYVYFDFFGENRPEFDKVRYQGKDYFIFGRRKSGYFDIRDLNGEKINKGSISYKKLRLVETRRSYLTERRLA
jgi:protein-tyrosine phosphatase